MKRIKSLDGLKYILITLVVIGHFIEPSRYNNIISGHLYSLIYSFHMPLFIWMNGFFYKNRILSEEVKKCLPLFEVCIISHIAFALLKDGCLTLSNMLFFSYTPAWYLLSLIYWRIASSLLIGKYNVKIILIFSILLEVVTFVVVPKYGGFLSLVRAFQFYPFFILGYLMKNYLSLLEQFLKPIIFIGVISLFYIMITSCYFQHQCFFQRAGLLELKQLTEHSLLWILAFRYSIIVSSTAVCALVLLLSYRSNYLQKVALYGQGTLFIYFGQTLLYPISLRYCSALTTSLIASAFAIIFLTYLSSKPLSKWIMSPITSLLASKQLLDTKG